MITVYGMNDKVGKVSYYDPNQDNTFTKPYSDETAKLIDEEVRKLIDAAYVRTISLLSDKREEVEKLAKKLLEKEVLFQSDVEALIGKRPYEHKKLLDDDAAVEPVTIATDTIPEITQEATPSSDAQSDNPVV
jgi:cell division protease FtsH